MENSESITFIGGSVKALEVGKIGGYLVRFGNETDTDLEGEYFTKSTDFGTMKATDVLYHHGMDAKLGTDILGTGEIKADDTGLWIETQLNMRTKYEKAVHELAKAGRLSWSSGAPAHLTRRESTGKSTQITTWRIAEASLTPTPAEPRNIAVPIKSIPMPPDILVVNVQDVSEGTDNSVIENAPVAESESTIKTHKKEEPEMENEKEAVEMPENTTSSLTADEVSDLMDAKFASFTKTVTAKFSAPSIISARGDKLANEATEIKSILMGDKGTKAEYELKASNDTSMNIGTAADGGNAVPTGHFNQIVARRDESMLNLGVRSIPGIGTTVNVPVDSEDDGEFVTTAEAATYDRDAPAIGTVAMTLVKYTKRIILSEELLDDEASNLMAFISDFIGRGMAKTHNNLLVTEALAGGTNLVTLGSNSTIAASEVQDVKFGLASEYRANAQWVMANATEGVIRKIQGSDFLYNMENRQGYPTIAGHQVHNSQYVPAIATVAKSLLFGDFGFMGVRNANSIKLIRDVIPATGEVGLYYSFRTVYKVLQGEAIGYATHAV